MPTHAPPLLYRIVDRLGRGIPAFVQKHPALVAGGVGVGYGATQLRKPVHQVEGSIMREYVGAPGAKYSSADLEKFAERKKFLDTKMAFEKVSQPYGRGLRQPPGAPPFPPIYVNPPPQDVNINMPPKTPKGWAQSFSEGIGGGVGGGIAAEGLGAIRRLL